MISNAACHILWLMDIRPLVKKYTGGKAHGWWWSTAIFQDYALARKIIRPEKIKTPSGMRFIQVLVLINLAFIIASIIEINWHNQKLDPTVKTPVESGNVQGTAGQL
jgi:hypothetical protein